MTIGVGIGGSQGLMAGLLARINTGGAGRVYAYNGARPATGAAHTATLVCMCLLAQPAGTVNASGDLVLAQGTDSTVLGNLPPQWARVCDGNDNFLFDCHARLSNAANTGQELVFASTGMFLGGLTRIVSGTLSGRTA